MGSGGNGGAVARGPSSNPAPMRSAIDAGWSPVFNGPNCAAGFPSLVMMIRSPAIARRIAPLVWFRRSRMPIRSTPTTDARVDTYRGPASLNVASPVSGPTRDRLDPSAASTPMTQTATKSPRVPKPLATTSRRPEGRCRQCRPGNANRSRGLEMHKGRSATVSVLRSATRHGDDAARSARSASATPSCSVNSFTAGTLITMFDETRRTISEVEIGDKVLATDPQPGETGVRPVR